MDFLVKFASAFMGVFQLGGEQFMGWVTGIIPTILMLLVMMNAVIALIGDERIEVIAKVCTSNPLLRYAVLPWLSAFMLGNPMALSMGKFMPEFYKPSYYAAASYHCHTNSGIFPHINPSEILIYLGIAQGITSLGLDATPLALRYMLVGFIANFISGWATDFTTAFVEIVEDIYSISLCEDGSLIFLSLDGEYVTAHPNSEDLLIETEEDLLFERGSDHCTFRISPENAHMLTEMGIEIRQQ